MSDIPPFSDKAKSINIGQSYRHYKRGTVYKILAIGRHTEDLSEMVIYQDTSAPEKVWCRPVELFLSKAEKDGGKVVRFELIQD